MKKTRFLLAAGILAALLTACSTTRQVQQHKPAIALFGGSFSVIPASDIATLWWEEQLGAEVVKYGAGGAGFSNLTQNEGRNIQWQIDKACAPEAPVYDTYVLWASTNDFNKVNDRPGTAWDYTEADGYDRSKLDTQCGGINYAIKRIREKAPASRILFMTSTKCFSKPGAGTDVTYSGEGNGMNDFVAAQMLCCQLAGVPFLDLFTLPPFNDENFMQYTADDHLHLNENGYKAIRDLQVHFLREGRTIRGPQIQLRNHSDNDWARFRRYAPANSQLQGNPAAVLYGDSITDNWPRADADFFSSNNFVGRGISGQTTAQGLVRFRADVVELHPKYAVILFGINDIAENNGSIALEHAVENLASMVEIARANGIQPILCTVLPAASCWWRKEIGGTAVQVTALNRMIKDMAAAKAVPLVDYWTAMNDGNGGLPPEYAADGVHPTPEGYKVMEKLLMEKIGTIKIR